jgi:hypothetical protein
MDGYASIVFLRRQARMPAGGYGHLVAARVQFPTQQLRLAVGASNKGRVVIACQKNTHTLHLLLILFAGQDRLGHEATLAGLKSNLPVDDTRRIGAI